MSALTKSRCAVLTGLMLLSGAPLVEHQDISQSTKAALDESYAELNGLYSGSSRKEEEATAKSTVIFVGKIKLIGKYGAQKVSGMDAYDGVKVVVAQTLKGFIDSPATLSLWVSNVAIENLTVIESPPKVGHSYIFFVKQEPGWNIVIKLIPTTDDSIARVKQIVARRP